MKRFLASPSKPSERTTCRRWCPDVVVTSAWVSPRVKMAPAVGSGEESGFDPDVADFVEGAGVWSPLLFDSTSLRGRFVRGESQGYCFNFAWAFSSSSGISACSFFLSSFTSK